MTGGCSTCHNGSSATGKPNGHFQTNRQCDECHTTTRWSGVRYSHSSGNFPTGHSSSIGCRDCHIGNSETSAWRNPAYAPDCAGCHAQDFKQGPHKKYEQPQTAYYRVDELRDCTGSCHVYTDASMTQIKKSRTGEHRASKKDW
ncbi:MAG: hypothetical protein D6688_10140 [Alphaproteobacteria bacterium]|nr:MAG: hypothetical protein D6688_10140 [Alphaproteobacteria bacterium]